MKYNFYIDTKFTVWERSHRSIEANSEEEAIEIAKGIFKDDGGQNEIELETLFDTQESMSVEENGGLSTVELIWPYDQRHNSNGGTVIMDNRPIAVVRDEKIDKILDEK